MYEQNTGENHSCTFEPHPHDVLYGRGKGPAQHAGNMFLRQLTFNRKQEYKKTHENATKRKIALEVDNIIKNLEPPGRFLAPSEILQDAWVEESHEKSLQKICQSLRETHKQRNMTIVVLNKKLGLLDNNGSFQCFSRHEKSSHIISEGKNSLNSLNDRSHLNPTWESKILPHQLIKAREIVFRPQQINFNCLRTPHVKHKFLQPQLTSRYYISQKKALPILLHDSLFVQAHASQAKKSPLDDHEKPSEEQEIHSLPLKKRKWQT